MLLRLRHFLIFGFLSSAIIISLVLGFWLRFDFTIPVEERHNFQTALGIALGLKLVLFYLMQLHRGWLTVVGFSDLARIVATNLISFVLLSIAVLNWPLPGFPRSVLILDFVLGTVCLGGVRMLFRLYHELSISEMQPMRKNVVIYGAGSAGRALAREIQANTLLGFRLVGFLDDSHRKRGELVHSVPVLGTGEQLDSIVRARLDKRDQIDQVLIAMPSANAQVIRKAMLYCRNAGVPCKTLPGLGELLADNGLGLHVRDICLEDLLHRPPVQLDEDNIRCSLMSKAVMVTGAAGSIGSELCRQIARFSPSVLVLFDQAESPLYAIDLELRSKFPDLVIVPVVGDIRNYGDVEAAIQGFSIAAIFHAAAYKHVPLMEAHVLEAMRNNVLGTHNLAEAAESNGVERFVLISSDKAVNPTNVMGATKRACEHVCCSRTSSRTRFMAVRFGNVLGSNGSVVPLFKAQIAAGGPVTVTHPDIRRYFMTIPEAVQLVLQASTMGRGSDIFVLDMGSPVKIVDMARNLIRLAGLIPDQDIQIQFTGLRPGEKLFEELIYAGENIVPTDHPKIRGFETTPMSEYYMSQWIDDLQLIIDRRDATMAMNHLKKLVHEYKVSRASIVVKSTSSRTKAASATA